jgi:hypothetical protein
MKLRTLITACVVAAIVPVTALADPAAQADKANGARACNTLRTTMTEPVFNATYRNFGACVSQWTRAEHQNRHAAATACAAEQADPNFAASHGGKTFAQFYGVGKKGAAAMQRCVKAKRAAALAADLQATENAAKKCKAERALNPAAFKTKYGTGPNKSNAFGKCVSKLATG